MFLQRPSNQNDVEKFTRRTHHERDVICCYGNVSSFNFKHEFESSKDTLWCYMKDTNLCIKCNILERCLHYLMIIPRTIAFYAIGEKYPGSKEHIYLVFRSVPFFIRLSI